MKIGNNRKKTGKVTLSDVAKAVDVSPMTVSRAIHNPEKVKEDIREKIQLAIKELGYIQNSAASYLASSRSKTIILVTNSFHNWIFQKIYPFLSSKIKKQGYKIRIAPLEDDRDIEYTTDLIIAANPELIVFFSLKSNYINWDKIERSNIPFFNYLCDENTPKGICDFFFDLSVIFDKTLDHLVSHNHEKIGLLTSKRSPYSFDDQVVSQWNRSMLQRNKSPEQIFHHLGTYETHSIYGTLEGFLKTWPDINALICTDPLLAYATYQYCLRNGINIPNQCAIVCLVDDFNPYFNDIQCTRLSFDYKEAASLIFNQIKCYINEEKIPPRIGIKPSLIIGRTI